MGDNYFFTSEVAKLFGVNRWKLTSTMRRDRLPEDVPKWCFEHKRLEADHRSRAHRFENPIVAVKYVKEDKPIGEKAYVHVHVSFQSTGSTNISMINAVDEVNLYVRPEARGKGDTKRVWAIEMNQGRGTYLGGYGSVDSFDRDILKWSVHYITVKWWHAAAMHGDKVSDTMAYYLYKDVATGGGSLGVEIGKTNGLS